eukprot:SAG31_NODE_705_length_12695_cov_3.147007_4_plen_115_part_00
MGGFEVVLPEVLIKRLIRNTGRKAQCPLPGGSWAAAAGDLPECYFPGDGRSCIFECARLQQSAGGGLPFGGATGCDLGLVGAIRCRNLTLERRGILKGVQFICGDTGLPCSESG